MKVITFPADKASAASSIASEELLLSLFRALPPKDKNILLNVVNVMARPLPSQNRPVNRTLTLV